MQVMVGCIIQVPSAAQLLPLLPDDCHRLAAEVHCWCKAVSCSSENKEQKHELHLGYAMSTVAAHHLYQWQQICSHRHKTAQFRGWLRIRREGVLGASRQSTAQHAIAITVQGLPAHTSQTNQRLENLRVMGVGVGHTREGMLSVWCSSRWHTTARCAAVKPAMPTCIIAVCRAVGGAHGPRRSAIAEHEAAIRPTLDAGPRRWQGLVTSNVTSSIMISTTTDAMAAVC